MFLTCRFFNLWVRKAFIGLFVFLVSALLVAFYLDVICYVDTGNGVEFSIDR